MSLKQQSTWRRYFFFAFAFCFPRAVAVNNRLHIAARIEIADNFEESRLERLFEFVANEIGNFLMRDMLLTERVEPELERLEFNKYLSGT